MPARDFKEPDGRFRPFLGKVVAAIAFDAVGIAAAEATAVARAPFAVFLGERPVSCSMKRVAPAAAIAVAVVVTAAVADIVVVEAAAVVVGDIVVAEVETGNSGLRQELLAPTWDQLGR
jgi:hypothetical protein